MAASLKTRAGYYFSITKYLIVFHYCFYFFFCVFFLRSREDKALRERNLSALAVLVA